MKKTLFAIALAAALPLSANAAERSYTFVEGTYNEFESGIDGFGLRGSFAFGDTGLYALGQFQDLSRRSLDVEFWELGLGYALNLNDHVDLIAEAAHTDFDAIDGYRISAGVRGNITSKLEGIAKVNYRDVDFVGSDYTYTAGLQYTFNPTWGLTSEIEFDGDGGETYLFGLRARF